jgi:IS1 family transposase
MNKLSQDKQILILSSLVEGNSIRSIERITGVHRDTIIRLMVSAGNKAQSIMDNDMMNLKSNFIEVDEIWSYVGKKQKNLSSDERYYEGGELGDQYTFVAIDAETKLVPCYRVGKRTAENTQSFMNELNTRINSRFQLSTDSFTPYHTAVRRTFKDEIDYAQIHKEYREDAIGEKRYSPAQIKKINIIPLIGNPDLKHISTSYVERQNLTMRMSMRRFTRLTNAFSKKLENLKSAVSLHFFYYNYIREHKTLKMTPCMKAGLTRNFVTWEMFLGMEEKKIAA